MSDRSLGLCVLFEGGSLRQIGFKSGDWGPSGTAWSPIETWQAALERELATRDLDVTSARHAVDSTTDEDSPATSTGELHEDQGGVSLETVVEVDCPVRMHSSPLAAAKIV
jgi:hypothetical protein